MLVNAGFSREERGETRVGSRRVETRAEDAHGTPIQSHRSPSILVYEHKVSFVVSPGAGGGAGERGILTRGQGRYASRPRVRCRCMLHENWSNYERSQ